MFLNSNSFFKQVHEVTGYIPMFSVIQLINLLHSLVLKQNDIY